MSDARPAGPPTRDAAAAERSLRARLAHLEAERSEADHRIAGSLGLAAGALRMQRARVADEAARDALAAAEMRLLGIARLHRRIQADDAAGRIGMRAFLEGLAADMRAALGLAFVVGCDEFSVPHGVATQLAVVLGELALNAARHAYDGRGRGRVVIECRRRGGGFRITVSDHGPGLPEGFEASRSDGLGMPLVDAAVRRLGGTLGAHTDGGAVFVLTVPSLSEEFEAPPAPRLGGAADGAAAG